MSASPFPAPSPNVETQPFWDAAQAERFVLPRCEACGRAHWYPRALCPFCRGTCRLEPSEGRGRIYSYSVTRGEAPYVIAFVRLDDGPTLLTNIVDCDPAAVHIDAEVEIVFRPSASGQNIPVVVLAGGDGRIAEGRT